MVRGKGRISWRGVLCSTITILTAMRLMMAAIDPGQNDFAT